ncbi:hypothetical protein FGB62_32g152 [Gracilaria domingensis]|nr:hypothetical protein FGB62_32g152 [Gracilaria domingensis]
MNRNARGQWVHVMPHNGPSRAANVLNANSPNVSAARADHAPPKMTLRSPIPPDLHFRKRHRVSASHRPPPPLAPLRATGEIAATTWCLAFPAAESMPFDKRVAYAVAGITAAGVGFGTAYYLYRSQTKSSTLVTLPVRIEKYHEEYLQQAAQKYTQDDVQKAFQTIVQHCMDATSNETSDELIFKTVRCNACGKKEKIAFDALLSKPQTQFITSMIAKHGIGGGEEKVVRILLEYCINEVDDAVIFAQ